jgi:hypothetical protein
MKLSKDFLLHEFTRSQTAARLGREIVPSVMETGALAQLCIHVLQPLRDAIGVTITITSGLRPAWLNPLIGGSKTSQHINGEAADIVAQGFTPLALCEEVINLKLPFDQLIYEFGANGWTHVSYTDRHRGKVLTAQSIGGKTQYLEGLVP